MIVSVTANTALDHTLFVNTLIPHTTNRASASTFSMAGKPADAAWVLSELGISSLALGFAAGNIGRQMDEMLRERGIQTDFVWVDGQTRINTVIVEQGNHPQTTVTTNTLIVSPAHTQQLQEKYTHCLGKATCIIIGGSLPKNVPVSLYENFVSQARSKGIAVVLDATGAALRAGLNGSPSAIKPNRDELEELVGYPVKTNEQIYQAACQVYQTYHTGVVASLGGDGALACLGDRAYWIPPLKVEVSSPAGAGDAVTAGLAFAFAEKKPIEEGLRLGIAAAAAVVMRPGTADCRREDIERFLLQVQLIPYHNSDLKK
jgi:1-phosphofructokinase family hexose kinase